MNCLYPNARIVRKAARQAKKEAAELEQAAGAGGESAELAAARARIAELEACRGTWARVTIDQFRHLSLQTFQGHRGPLLIVIASTGGSLGHVPVRGRRGGAKRGGGASPRTNLDTRHSNRGEWARDTADQFRHSALRTFTKRRASSNIQQTDLSRPVVGRGHASLQTNLGTRHSESLSSTGHSLIIILSKEA